MSSGRKALRQNTRERVISTDFNRQQSFQAGWNNEALRRQMLTPQDDSYAVGTTFPTVGAITVAVDTVVPSAPDYAGILNGLMVVLPTAASYLLITSGMLLVVDPEGMPGSSDPSPLNPDDGPGPSRLVYSDGVNVAGALPYTPNPGLGVRVDIVEVQRKNVVSETDNRDIFDPSTGLFTPQAVTKVTVGDLTFRIRLGVAGGGLPGPALGWVPLCVLASAGGAVTLDQVAAWDVRPLLSDLSDPYAQVRSVIPRIDRYRMVCERFSTPGQLKLSGEAQGTYLGWRIGGLFVEPDVANHIDLLNAPFYQAFGFVPVAGLPYYVYALWPGGYVRWVRYHTAAVPGIGGRCPGAFRGIIAVSQTPPLLGQPIAPIAIPPAWGLNTSTVIGQMVAAGGCNTIGAVLDGFVADGDEIHLERPFFGIVPFGITTPAAGTEQVAFVLTPGVHFPAGTRRIRAVISCAYNGIANDTAALNAETVEVATFAGANPMAFVSRNVGMLPKPPALPFALDNKTHDIPVAADGISTPPAMGFLFTYSRVSVGGSGVGVLSAASLNIIGWDE